MVHIRLKRNLIGNGEFIPERSMLSGNYFHIWANVDNDERERYSMRTFEGGATRDDCDEKPEFASFLSPIVLRAFGRFMMKHNTQADGKKRSMSNWKSGIPRKVYLESMFRHFVDVWEEISEPPAGDAMQERLEDALCAMLFNV